MIPAVSEETNSKAYRSGRDEICTTLASSESVQVTGAGLAPVSPVRATAATNKHTQRRAFIQKTPELGAVTECHEMEVMARKITVVGPMLEFNAAISADKAVLILPTFQLPHLIHAQVVGCF